MVTDPGRGHQPPRERAPSIPDPGPRHPARLPGWRRLAELRGVPGTSRGAEMRIWHAGSLAAAASRTSTSTTSSVWAATSSRTWPPACSSTRPAILSCWARPAPAGPTWRSGSASRLSNAATGSRSRQRSTESPVSRPSRNLGTLNAELSRLRRYGLSVVDEIRYILFGQDAANLSFNSCHPASAVFFASLDGCSRHHANPAPSRDSRAAAAEIHAATTSGLAPASSRGVCGDRPLSARRPPGCVRERRYAPGHGSCVGISEAPRSRLACSRGVDAPLDSATRDVDPCG